MTASFPTFRAALAISVFVAPLCALSLLAEELLIDAEVLFRQANADFTASDHEAAIRKYEALVENDYLSADLLYNLGTSYYRAGHPGVAALWLNRAQLLNPSLPEARQNLQFLSRQLGFLQFDAAGAGKWIRSLHPGIPRWTSACFFWIALISAIAPLSHPRIDPFRSKLLSVALVSLLIALLGWRVGHLQQTRYTPRAFSIVTAEDVRALTAPAVGAGTVIDLPAGSEIRVIQSSGPWSYVDIPGDVRGWVRADEVTDIWPVTTLAEAPSGNDEEGSGTRAAVSAQE